MDRKSLVTVRKEDFVISWFNGGGGAGGQHKNRHQNCVRLLHVPSGAQSQATKERSAQRNLEAAFGSLIKSKLFEAWLKIETSIALGKPSIDEVVEKLMHEKNLKIEVRLEETWVEIKNEEFEM